MSEVMSTLRRALFSLGLAAAAVGGLPGEPSAAAQEVTLRVQHFLPQDSTTHKDFIEHRARKVEAESGGRTKIALYNSLQTGGTPTAHDDQDADGVDNNGWTM